MNLRNNDEVIVRTRARREKYSQLEERMMWFFFARELRAGNEDALKKRPILWKQYEQEEVTSKKMMGLESHFRKYMINKIHKASMNKQDMFLCLRFFGIQLNRQQQINLEQRFGCDIDCDVDGSFRRAHFLIGKQNITLPTPEEEATILGIDGEDEIGMELEEDIEEVQQHRQTQPQHQAQPHQQQHQGQPQIQPQKQQAHQSQNLAQPQHQVQAQQAQPSVTLPTNDEEATILRIGVEDEMEMVLAENTQVVQQQNQTQTETAKKVFIDGALNLFDGKINARMFLDPFLYLNGGKYADYARGIKWLVSDDDDQEFAYR